MTAKYVVEMELKSGFVTPLSIILLLILERAYAHFKSSVLSSFVAAIISVVTQSQLTPSLPAGGGAKSSEFIIPLNTGNHMM